MQDLPTGVLCTVQMFCTLGELYWHIKELYAGCNNLSKYITVVGVGGGEGGWNLALKGESKFIKFTICLVFHNL